MPEETGYLGLKSCVGRVDMGRLVITIVHCYHYPIKAAYSRHCNCAKQAGLAVTLVISRLWLRRLTHPIADVPRQIREVRLSEDADALFGFEIRPDLVLQLNSLVIL